MAEPVQRKNGKTRARRWTEAEARQAVMEWRASGLSGAAFARKKGISAMRLPYWERRLGTSGSADVNFVAMPLSAAASEVELKHEGVTIRVRELDVDTLARLVIAIARRAREC